MSQHQHSDGPCPDGEACPDARRYGDLHPAPSQHTSGRTALPFDQCDSFSTPSTPSQPAEGPTPETDALYGPKPLNNGVESRGAALARSLERRMNEALRELASVKKIAEGLVSKNERYAAKSDLQARNFAKCQEELAALRSSSAEPKA